MKKQLKWWLMALLISLPAVALTACGDDDDDLSSTGIVGNWWNGERSYSSGRSLVYVFKSNGQYVGYEAIDFTARTYDFIWCGTWKYNKDTRILTLNEDDGDIDTYRVESVSDKTLVLYRYYEDDDSWHGPVTYTRVGDSMVPTTLNPNR